MTVSHTPGPWSVEMPDSAVGAPGIVAADFTDIVYFNCGGGDSGVHGRSADVALANARLIAAAPELLAALREAAELIGVVARSTSNRRESSRWADMHRRAFEAIAKATGQGDDIQPREVA